MPLFYGNVLAVGSFTASPFRSGVSFIPLCSIPSTILHCISLTFISPTSAPRTRVAPSLISGKQSQCFVALSVPLCLPAVLSCFANFTTLSFPQRPQDSFTPPPAIPFIHSIATLAFARASLNYGMVSFLLPLVHPSPPAKP